MLRPPPLWFSVQTIALVGLLSAHRWGWATAVGALLLINLRLARER